MLTTEKIKQAIIGGESLFVEFKEDFSNTDDIAAEITALANTEGGTIIFGVKDNGEIKGLDKVKKIEETIMNLVRQNIYPPLTVEFLALKLQNKMVAAIDVPKGIGRPYQTNKGVFYIRVGTTKRKATFDEIYRSAQDAGRINYDLTPVTGTSIKSIDEFRVNQYYKKVFGRDLYSESLSSQQLMINLDILSAQGGPSDERGIRATVGGLLLFGNNLQKDLPGAYITVVRYLGKEVTSEILDRQDFLGALPEQVDGAFNFIKRNMSVSSAFDGLKRIDQPEYPLEAVRELIANAAVHRNYSIQGSQIRIFMFNDRMWVSSPGRLPNTINLENIKYKKFIRNQFITRFMLNLGYIEMIGSGIMKVIILMKQQNQTEPKFELFDEEFRVTLLKEKN